MLFQCTLIDCGFIRQNFFREGSSAKEIKEFLGGFDFGAGEWRITDPVEWDYDDEDEEF